MTGTGAPVLEVEGLGIAIRRRAGDVALVTDVDFRVDPGETVGLVGESGCGKTVTALSVMGLLPVPLVASGSVRLEGTELLGLRRRRLDALRGPAMAMIFQDAVRSLDPLFTVGDQIAEPARRHLGLSTRAARARSVELLDLVGIDRPADRARAYPHQLSGGMCQRVMIASALVCEPRLLIADEPTTALDVTVQDQVLGLLARLREELGLAMLFITHDLGVVAETCDRVVVMYAGEVVEEAGVLDLFERPSHPYTAGLLAAVPQPDHRGKPLQAIAGSVPAPTDWPVGCRFGPRCDHRIEPRCTSERPGLAATGDAVHRCRCARVGELPPLTSTLELR